MFLLLALLFTPFLLNNASSSACVCTTVDCPKQGINNIVMGGGGSSMKYTYEKHGDYDVVVYAEGIVYPSSLDHGTGTTSCTQKYSRLLEDDGYKECDAGHILANRLGGYGNLPVNIFPQNSSINRGAYALYEEMIYYCLKDNNDIGYLSWLFMYDNNERTMPSLVQYNASFLNCKNDSVVFSNN